MARLVEQRDIARETIIAWLNHRAKMCVDAKRWYRPFHNRTLGTMAGTFRAAALCITYGADLAKTPEAETAAIKAAQVSPRPRDVTRDWSLFAATRALP